MKNLILLLAVALLFLNAASAQEKEKQKDSSQKVINDKVKAVLEKKDSIEVGFFSKRKSKIRIFTKSEYKNKDEWFDSIYKQVDSLNNIGKILDRLEGEFNSKEVTKAINQLLKHKVDSINKKIEALRKDTDINMDTFEKEWNRLSKSKVELKKAKEKNLKKYFATVDKSKIKEIKKNNIGLWDIEKVSIDVFEGQIVDLVITLTNINDKRVRKFTNNTSISVVRFRKYGLHKLFETNGSGAFIRVKDVIDYTSNTGLNYFPDNAMIDFEKNDTIKPLQIQRGLKSILDLRVYTDFLGLIENESNGIINFEASSTIRISPSPISKLKGEFLFLKEITPYFNYSRFDNENRAIPTDTTNNASNFKLKNKLSLIQNAFVKAGFELNVLQIKAQKEFPIAVSFPFFYEFNMTEVALGAEKLKVNTYQMGTGIRIGFKRTKNFGLNIGMSYSDVKNKQSANTLKQESSFHLLGFNSEVYFFDPKDRNSAFFIRLKTRRVTYKENNFASIQFGYKKAFSFSK